ncbi:DinB family protein [Membranihabitans maritimus]|uniref:DinB family protein n=1 Tax=Membranihabitans maritimus TaxID=2904244 RepID=UPI001F1E3C38|nr:DinB family protein [Membranihabitans maritimus]
MIDSRQNTLNEFHKTTATLLQLLLSLSEEQLNFQPKNGWSAGQFGEHLCKSYAFVETLEGKTKKTERPIDQKMEPIKILFSDTSIQMEAPSAILPSSGKIVKNDLIQCLKDRIEQIKQVIQTKDLSLTCTDFSIPEYGEFTRFEWIWFNIYHTQRHIYQLENMIASNNMIATKRK